MGMNNWPFIAMITLHWFLYYCLAIWLISTFFFFFLIISHYLHILFLHITTTSKLHHPPPWAVLPPRMPTPPHSALPPAFPVPRTAGAPAELGWCRSGTLGACASACVNLVAPEVLIHVLYGICATVLGQRKRFAPAIGGGWLDCAACITWFDTCWFIIYCVFQEINLSR